MQLNQTFKILSAVALVAFVSSCGTSPEDESKVKDQSFGLYREFNFTLQNNLHYNHYFVVEASQGARHKSVAIPDGAVTSNWWWSTFGNGRNDCGDAEYKGIHFGDHGGARTGGPIFGAANCGDRNREVASVEGSFQLLSSSDVMALRSSVGGANGLRLEIHLESSASSVRAERILHDRGLIPYAGRWVTQSTVGVSVADIVASTPTSITRVTARPDAGWYGDTLLATIDIRTMDTLIYKLNGQGLSFYFKIYGGAVQLNQFKVRILRPF